MMRLCKQIAQDFKPGMTFQKSALTALHEAAERLLIDLFTGMSTKKEPFISSSAN